MKYCLRSLLINTCKNSSSRLKLRAMSTASNPWPKLNYPPARRQQDVVEEYPGGNKVTDHYRWLESPDSPETQEWVQKQVKLCDSVLKPLPDRKEIFFALRAASDYERFTCTSLRGRDKFAAYYFRHNSGLKNHMVIMRQKTLEDEPTVFLDPNELSADGTVAVNSLTFSKSGEYVAIKESSSGSDWQRIKVGRVDESTGQLIMLDDLCRWVKFSSVAWTHDSMGFFYCRYAEPSTTDQGTETDKNQFQQVWYHRINTDQSEDRLVYCDATEADWMFGAELTDCGRYLLITVSESCENVNRLYVVDLTKYDPYPHEGSGVAEPIKLIDNFDACWWMITNDESKFYLMTNYKAPKFRIVSIELGDGDKAQENLTELIAERDDVINGVTCVAERLVITYLHDVASQLLVFLLDGTEERRVELPSIGTVAPVTGEREHRAMFFSFTSFVNPGEVFRYDFDTHTMRSVRRMEVAGHDPDMFITEQVFYESKDGTRIPMFVVRRSDVPKDGNQPTLLYGYGGFNISLEPYFNAQRLVWLNNYRGVFALANIRGGGEYGEDWHQLGTKDRKQNVFDDFQAAARTLVKLNYTNAARLAIEGGSNGGLLVAACLLQAPELFGCVVCHVGVLDMLRFHRFTIGYAWCSDYGNADESEEAFKYLLAYSPLHNAKWNGKELPPTLMLTADHDDRVSPLHTFKFAAELQHNVGSRQEQTNPLLVRIDVKAGHGAGKPLTKVLEEKADVFAFMARSLNIRFEGMPLTDEVLSYRERRLVERERAQALVEERLTEEEKTLSEREALC